MMKTSFYSEEELSDLGFRHIGKGCKISRNACFYGRDEISIGDNVRIDDFCLLSGKIAIGSNIHVAAYTALYGNKYGILLEDYSGISARCTVYAAMDDFSGDFLIGPIHPEEKIRVTGGTVIVRKYAQIGAHSLVFPGVEIGEGCAIGACSLVRDSMKEWSICFGVPARWKKDRSKKLLDLI